MKSITLVSGSRQITDYKFVKDILQTYDLGEIICGGAIGVDQLAIRYATESRIPYTIYKPQYALYGRRAPLVRNEEMVQRADYAIAIWDGKSRGTKFTIDYAHKQNKKVFIHIQ